MIKTGIQHVFFLVFFGFSVFGFSAFGVETPVSQTEAAFDYLTIRDPFKRMDSRTGGGVQKSPLELVSLDQIKMIGVVTGPDKFRALLADGSGNTHFVSRNTRIGPRGGIVTRITSESILIRERTVNVIGQTEYLETQIMLQADSKLSLSPVTRTEIIPSTTASPAGQEAKK